MITLNITSELSKVIKTAASLKTTVYRSSSITIEDSSTTDGFEFILNEENIKHADTQVHIPKNHIKITVRTMDSKPVTTNISISELETAMAKTGIAL